MRTESTAYAVRRKLYVNTPRHVVHFAHVQAAGAGTSYPFSRAFSTGPVLTPLTPMIECVQEIGGNTQSVDPVAFRSTIGVLPISLVDVQGRLLPYVSDPARPLFADITAAATPTQIEVDDASGYPVAGHVILGGVTAPAEDFKYTGRNLGVSPNLLTGVTRAQRGTTARAHGAGTLVRNGEQIRKGQRVTLSLGYAPEIHAEFTEYVTLEVVNVEPALNGLQWTVRASDIQRFVKKTVFEGATEATPFEIGPEHMIDIALKVLTSTGAGTNGGYDVLAATDAGGVAAALVDVAGLESLRTELGTLSMQFSEIEPVDLKEFLEGQLFRLGGLVPFVTQEGKYGARRLRPPVFARSGISVPVVIAGTAPTPPPPTAITEEKRWTAAIWGG